MHLAKLTFRFFVRYKERVGSIRRELQGAKSMAEDYRVRKKKVILLPSYCCFTGLNYLLRTSSLENQMIDKMSSDEYPFLCTARGSGRQQYVHKTIGGNEKHHE